jgi:hypothetical protein
MDSDIICSIPVGGSRISYVASLLIMAAATILLAKSWWTDWD